MYREVLHQTLAHLTVFFNEFSIAIGYGWIAPVLPYLRSSTGEFHLTLDECSWIVSLSHMGKVFGPILSALLLDRIGRKSLLSSSAAIFLIAWLLIFYTRSTYILYLARLGTGLASGITLGVNSVYLGEISSPSFRSIFGYTKNLFYNIGFLFEVIIATYFTYRTTAMINGILEFVFYLTTFLLVEPPQYLLMKHKFKQAEKNFLWLQGVSALDNVKIEFEKIEKNISEEKARKSSYRKILIYPANYKSMMINSIYAFLLGILGYHSIMSFATLVFPTTKVLTTNQFLIILQAFSVLWCFLLTFIMNHFNRRPTLLLSCLISFFGHACTTFLYYVEENITKIPNFPWLIFVFVTPFLAVFPVIYATTFLIRGELFPMSIKPLGNCISVVCYAGSCFLATKMFLHISHCYGIYANFLIFCLASFAMLIFTYFFLPETRNKSLVEIQELLEKKDSKKIVQIHE